MKQSIHTAFLYLEWQNTIMATAAQAAKTGGKKAFRAHLTALVLLQLYGVWEQTRGDAANGILFYFAFYWSVWVLLTYCAILGAAYLLGQKAGKEIFEKPGRYLISGIKFALIATAIPLVCIFAVGMILRADADIMLDMLASFLLPVAVPMLLIWLWTARRIKDEAGTEMEQEEKSE